MRAVRGAIAFVLSLAANAVSAQTPTTPATPPSLHAAWLTEVMDLDVKGAAAAYERVASGSGPRNLERWIAVARLTELHRTGAIAAAPPSAQDAPSALRPTFSGLQPLPNVDELLDRARRAPQEGLQVLVPEATKAPPLRPLVPAAEQWIVSQIGPSLRDRMRQRLQSYAARSRATDPRRFAERFYALDVVRAELQGRTAQATALRTLYFADWRAPTVPGEPGPHLARVRSNLESWLGDADLPTQQENVLRELKDAIEKLAASDPAAALALVSRLPLYAERLLDTPERR